MTIPPRKALGQHFLHESRIVGRIAGLVQPEPNETLLEIGPGPGALTAALLEAGHALTAVEVDPRAVALLREQFAAAPLSVVEASVLDYTPPPTPHYLVGNLPYNISSPIFFWLLAHRAVFRAAVVMVQLEVAQRICAPPGSRTYGLLSVLLGVYYTPKYQFKVAPGAFRPPPSVDSAVLTLTRHETAPVVNFNALKTLAKAAFQQRRKTLRNALKSLPVEVPEAYAGQRAEQLAPTDFVRLANLLAP